MRGRRCSLVRSILQSHVAVVNHRGSKRHYLNIPFMTFSYFCCGTSNTKHVSCQFDLLVRSVMYVVRSAGCPLMLRISCRLYARRAVFAISCPAPLCMQPKFQSFLYFSHNSPSDGDQYLLTRRCSSLSANRYQLLACPVSHARVAARATWFSYVGEGTGHGGCHCQTTINGERWNAAPRIHRSFRRRGSTLGFREPADRPIFRFRLEAVNVRLAYSNRHHAASAVSSSQFSALICSPFEESPVLATRGWCIHHMVDCPTTFQQLLRSPQFDKT